MRTEQSWGLFSGTLQAPSGSVWFCLHNPHPQLGVDGGHLGQQERGLRFLLYPAVTQLHPTLSPPHPTPLHPSLPVLESAFQANCISFPSFLLFEGTLQIRIF